MRTEAPESMVQALARLLRDHGETVLDGTRVLTLLTPCLQVVTRLFEQLFPRGHLTGFQALPVHPTDNVAILRTQFLLDVLQKTRALKLIHPPEGLGQFDVNILPFKSLRSLELRGVPPHCLRGLRGVYSQLEVLICSQCVTSLEEVISLCGGDLSSALPWLELHTLNVSYNAIHSLDQSLELLNSLRILDLSHNYIKECGSYLKVLSDLQYVNLSYNLLESVPELNLQSCAQLHTLILRCNELSSTSGLEHLSNVQHLDLSYNLLLDHSQLKGLARLHNLKKLFLEGNPLYYHKDHRALTARHLSPKTSDKVLLDGKQLTALETVNTQVFKERVVLPQPCNSATESSCTGDMSDSCSEKVTSRIPRKNFKVKVRRASISEPSDSECEQRGQLVVLKHQSDIERTDSFREQFGVDWLKYRPHLEDELSKDHPKKTSPDSHVYSQTFTKSTSSPTILQAAGKTHSQSLVLESAGPAQPPTSEVAADAVAADLLIEKIEDVLEDGLWGPKKIIPKEKEEEVEEEDVTAGAMCPHVTVCPILDGQPRNPDWPWIFLRVTRQHLQEIDLQRGRVLVRRELESLQDIQTSETQWDWNGKEQMLPVLTLNFHSVCEDKQSVCYVVLDNSSDISIKTLLDVLNPVLKNNLKLSVKADEGPPRLQCLKCKTEFNQQEGDLILNAETEKQMQRKASNGLSKKADDTGCPSCGSSHVILAHLCTSSTPTPSFPGDQPPEGADNKGQKRFYLGEDDADGSERSSSCQGSSDGTLNSTSTSAGSGGLTGSYQYGPTTTRHALNTSQSPNQTLDFRIVDHRLKLYLDMEILGGEMEEFQCAMKVPVVRSGKPVAFWALVVVSNEKIYFLDVNGDTSGPPCDWLRPGEEHVLSSITHLHLGLQKQSLHVRFVTAAYALLTRNRHHSTAFSQYILDSMADLPLRYRSTLDYSVEEEITQGHHLWPLLQDEARSSSPADYLYALVYFLQADDATKKSAPCANEDALPQNLASSAARAQGAANAAPVSLLLTRTRMYILEESHQWHHPVGEDAGRECADKVQVKEKQAISSISSVHLYKLAALHMQIRLYNETQQKESAWLLWTEDPDLPNDIVEWLRGPWEAEYHIRFNPVLHERLDR